MINRNLYDAKQEIKRADHLIYVSLKYTRTIDVMNNILERMMNTFDFIMDGVLEKAKSDGKIDSIPKIPGLKVEKLNELYESEKELKDYLSFYMLLRKIRKSSQLKFSEFRRGVRMNVLVDNQKVDVTIDIITDYYKRVVMFTEYIEKNFEKFLDEEEE